MVNIDSLQREMFATPKRRGKFVAIPEPKIPQASVVAKKKTSHPSTASMVTEAIQKLNGKVGSSLQAIKKSMNDTHKVDTEKLSVFIRKYLRKAVESGELIRTKGIGATGSFKLPSKGKSTMKKVRPALGKTTTVSKIAATKAVKEGTDKKVKLALTRMKSTSVKTVLAEEKSPKMKIDSKNNAQRKAKSSVKVKLPKAKTTKTLRSKKKAAPKQKK